MRQVLKVVLIVAVVVVVAFVVTAWKVTKVHEVDTSDAALHFRAVYEQFKDVDPMLTRDAAGTVIHHRRRQDALIPPVPSEIGVLAWRGPEIGLVEMHIPIWFLRMKGKAIQYIFERTGLDPVPWELNVDEIQEWGPGIVLDHRGRKDRVLVWAE